MRINKSMKEVTRISEYAKKYAAELGVLPDIHMDDFIFKFLIDNQTFDSIESAVRYYFYDGRASVEILSQLIKPLHMRLGDKLEMLEFASGYGCVTRHINSEMINVSSTACDIHPEAIGFIENSLNRKAIHSCRDPNDFKISKKFDVVFALSFFSHMPKKTWSKWLLALYEAVALGGLLIFTTHGQKSTQFFGDINFDNEGFYFINQSEQKDLDTADYGQTIVTESYVSNVIYSDLKNLNYVFKEGYWWGHQDCYIVQK